MGKVLFPDYFPNRCPPYDALPRWWTAELAGYMRMIWRVKKWEFIVNITNACASRLDCANINGDHYFTYKSTATIEEELVCGKELELESADTRHNFDIYYMNIYPLFIGYESFSPYSEMGARATGSGQDNGIDQGDLPEYEDLVKNLSTVYIENFGDDVASSPFTAFTRTYEDEDRNFYYTARVRAKEYWSYGGTYDTETGEPL